ncbi:DUF6551 family protein [Devosia sp. 1635]|uniref:DUF6551 family protein n=1 Tax=Devosia sp. 1635 TaxID=2726066 RepID=UPI0015630493|nr:DUF6551 family protein [Devosia sp. 1635]
MSKVAATLARAPNAVFGLLLACESGRPVAELAARAGLAEQELENILERARDGELPRVSSREGLPTAVVASPASPALAASTPALPVPVAEPPLPTPSIPPAVEEKTAMPEHVSGIGSKPRLDWVEVGLIDVDAAYQRAADDKSVQRIVDGFRWDHFGAVVLAEQASGRFKVTDGQHRVRAAQQHPEVTHVPALIISVAGTAAEADNFLTINRARRAVSTIEIYWAGLASGDSASVRVRDAVEKAGCSIIRTQAAYKAGQTGAVGAISRCLDRFGDNATVAALKIIRAAWPDDAKSLRGTLITALARIIRGNERVDRDRLIKVLAPKSFAELTAHAEAFRKLSGGSADTVLARTITELYNKGLSTNTIYFGEAV